MAKNNAMPTSGGFKAAKVDRYIAIGAFCTILALGLHLKWYYDYMETLQIFICMWFRFWRIPFIVFFWIFFPKERKYWGKVLSQYMTLLGEK